MVNSYFGFSCSPFENTLDQQFLFVSECHEEVIAALLYFIRDKKSFALVCGDVGTGKTMIIHHLLANLPRSVMPILISYPDVEYIEMLRYIAKVLDVDPEGKGALELTDELKAALTRANLDGKQVVLIIDEAHLLSKDSLENIRLASNIETTENKLIQTLLIGQNELELKLRGREMRQFRQRINISRVLYPMSPSETIEYIDHRLQVAGSSFARCFAPDCGKLLYKMTDGVPRSINQLCDMALLICMTEKSDKVTKKILSQAQEATDMPGGPASVEISYLKKFRPAFAVAALILLLILVAAIGYGVYLKGWFYGADAGKNNVSDKLSDHGIAASTQVPPTEAQAKTGGGATANEDVDSPGPDAGSDSTASAKTKVEEQIADKKHQSAQDGAGQGIGPKTGTPVAPVRGVRDEETTSESSDFIAVTVKKGESLSKIAARWFPEDPESGKKSILSANPQIDDKNRFLANQTLRIPRPKRAGPEDK